MGNKNLGDFEKEIDKDLAQHHNVVDAIDEVFFKRDKIWAKKQEELDNRAPEWRFAQVRALLSRSGVDRIKREAEESHYETGNTFDYIRRMAEVKEFDPNWQRRNYVIPELVRHEIFKDIIRSETNPLTLLNYLYNIKTLEPNTYKQLADALADALLEEQSWIDIAGVVAEREKTKIWDAFVINYAKAAFLDVGQISRWVDLRTAWPEVIHWQKNFRASIANLSDSSDAVLHYGQVAAASQSVQPEGSERAVFYQGRWSDCLKGLRSYINLGEESVRVAVLQNLVAHARDIKYVKVS